MKNKSLIIGGIVLSLMIVLSIGTYAYWTITRSQEGENTLIGGCLSIDISEEGEAISLDKAWPISDFEGMQLEGYTFKVTNDCEEPQDYRIDLDRLVEEATDKPMDGKYLAALLDYSVPVMYDDLESLETTEAGIKEKRVLAYDTVIGKGTNEHTLRLWIDETAPISEQGSKFLSKVQINAGQGIEKYYTPEECFTFDSANGSITEYDETKAGCTTDVVIPYEIIPESSTTPVIVRKIGRNAFRNTEITSVEFPRSVTTIDGGAFMSTLALEKVIFKDGLIDIADNSYNQRSERGKLSFVMFPSTLESIGYGTFTGNVLEQIIIPNNVVSVGRNSFLCNNLKKLMVGTGLKIITDDMFSSNELKEIVIPNSVEEIGQSAFSGNPIEKITFGTGLLTIGTGAFNNNDSEGSNYYNMNFLKEVYIPLNVTSIGDSAFGSTTNNVIIRTERTKEDFLANVTTSNLGGNWYGKAQVIDCNGETIY